MPLLLVIRSADDMPSAVADSNRFLAIQRGRSGNQRDDSVLGVWLREDVDIGLPRMSHDLVSSKADSITEGNLRPTPLDTVSGIRIGESTSLSGVWALCWIYGSLVHGAGGSLQRLRAVVHRLVRPYSMNQHGFFPVFPMGEPPDNIKRAMGELREQHPHLIARTWFIDDWDEGLIEAAPG